MQALGEVAYHRSTKERRLVASSTIRGDTKTLVETLAGWVRITIGAVVV